MNEDYLTELQQEIDFLFKELAFLQEEIEKAREEGDVNSYTKFMRTALAVEKQYLKLCAEQEQREANTETDELAAFNAE